MEAQDNLFLPLTSLFATRSFSSCDLNILDFMEMLIQFQFIFTFFFLSWVNDACRREIVVENVNDVKGIYKAMLLYIA